MSPAIRNIGLICLTLFCTISAMTAQNIKDYRWKNRLVLIICQNEENSKVIQQLQELQTINDELKDRKLLVFLLTSDTARLMLPDDLTHHNLQSDSFRKLAKKEESFEVLLIGLDGGIKMREKDVIKKETLFNKIDSMPMRKAEMRKKG